MNLPDTLRLATQGRLKRSVKRNIQAWFIDFCRRQQTRNRLDATRLPYKDFKHFLVVQMLRLRPDHERGKVQNGMWKHPCGLPASDVWTVLEKSMKRIFPTAVIAALRAQANDNPKPACHTYTPKKVRIHRGATVIKLKAAPYVPQPKQKTKAQKRADYIKWWNAHLHIVLANTRTPLTEAERQHLLTLDRQKKQAAQQAARSTGLKIAKLRQAASLPPEPTPAPTEGADVPLTFERALEKLWFRNPKTSDHRKKRAKFLARPGMQEAYDAYLVQSEFERREQEQAAALAAVRSEAA